jgi:osmotically inducible protein OsmC
MINRKGSAKWTGDLKTGRGQVSTETLVLDEQAYGFATRFESERGTNPEELIGAAHASCFSMALSMILGQQDLTPDEIRTTATVTLEESGGGFAITKVHLDVTARVPGADDEAFAEAANAAKENCPVSKLLNADITMDAALA